jgi:DNA-binding GntR family transcriptional regulator
MPKKDATTSAYVDAYLSGSAFDENAGEIGVTELLIRRLRVAILEGDLRPSQKLRESELCETYEVSRATLREALRILESERLVQLIPNRGPFVASLGLKEIDEIHDVWALLTGEAIYRFAERCKPADIEDLEKYVDQLRDAIEAEEPLAQLAATNHFFNFISTKGANSILHEITIGVVSRMMFLRAQSLRSQQWGHLYAEEIEDIVEAIRLRSPEDARAATKRHISSACAAAKQIALTPDSKPRSNLKAPDLADIATAKIGRKAAARGEKAGVRKA